MKTFCKAGLIGVTAIVITLSGAMNLFAGTATLSWQAPIANSDGTPLTDLAGYRVYYGTASGVYTQSLSVGNVTTYTINNLNDGLTYYFVTTAVNASGGESGFSNQVSKTLVATDTTAPTISSVIVSSVTSSSVTIAWTTNEAATTQVQYGTTTAYGSTTALNSSLVTSHSAVVSGLSANTTYHFRVVSRDASSNTAMSADISRITSASPTGTITEEWGNTSTSNHANTVEDTFINVDALNYSTQAQLNTYTWPVNSSANAILMKWDLSAIPAGAVIQSATLSLYLQGVDGTGGDASYNVTVHKIINRNPVIANATGATYDGVNGWTANSQTPPLAQADIAAATDSKIIDTALGYKSWNVTQLVQDWVNSPSSNFGLLLNSDTTAASDSNRYFSSSEHTVVSQRPKLVIAYTIPSGSQDTTPPAGTILINVGAAYTNNPSVTLAISASDSGSGMGAGSQMQFSNDGVTWSAAEAYSTSKNWTLSAGDGSKTVYAKFKDVAGNWTSAQIKSSITLDMSAPGKPGKPTLK